VEGGGEGGAGGRGRCLPETEPHLNLCPSFFGSQEMRGVGCPLLIHSCPGWMWFAVAEALLG